MLVSGRLDARVVGGDLRVVPLRDLPLEDARDRVGAQLEVFDSGQVVRDGHCAEQDREVQDRFGWLLGVLVGGVRARVVDGLLGKVRATLSGAASAVGDLSSRIGVIEIGCGFLKERQREAGAASLECSRDRCARRSCAARAGRLARGARARRRRGRAAAAVVSASRHEQGNGHHDRPQCPPSRSLLHVPSLSWGRCDPRKGR